MANHLFEPRLVRRPSVAQRVRAQTSFILAVPSLEGDAGRTVTEAEVPARPLPAVMAISRAVGGWYLHVALSKRFAASCVCLGSVALLTYAVPSVEVSAERSALPPTGSIVFWVLLASAWMTLYLGHFCFGLSAVCSVFWDAVTAPSFRDKRVQLTLFALLAGGLISKLCSPTSRMTATRGRSACLTARA
jgi:hypothetical protein